MSSKEMRRAGVLARVKSGELKLVNAAGQLTPIPGSPFTAGQGPNSITIDSGGPYLYAANAGSFNVSGYEINDVSAFSITQMALYARSLVPLLVPLATRPPSSC
jgi:hypothetical protein